MTDALPSDFGADAKAWRGEDERQKAGPRLAVFNPEPPPASEEDYGARAPSGPFEDAEPKRERRDDTPTAPTFRRVINPADWEGKPVPERRWIVPDVIPDETVAILSGDGSGGKSLLVLQLGAARALSKEWIGLLPEPGRTLILSAEDDEDEMQRRLDDIRKFYGSRMADLADMRLVDLVGEDSVLGELMKGRILPTPMYHTLDAFMTDFRPGLVVLDVLADMFAGDENSRPQAREFIGLLKRLARKHKCAFLLLAHPSLNGMATGAGTSGSTGWSNSVRSRLYLQGAKASDGSEPDKNLRALEVKKSNYGPANLSLMLEWKNGLFVPVHGSTGLDKLALHAKAEDVFIDLLKELTGQGRNVNANKGPTYAPAVFAKEDAASSITKAALEKAMERLLKTKAIKVEQFGPPSHSRTKLVIAEANA